MAWVSSGCGLISMKVLCRRRRRPRLALNRTGLRTLAAQCRGIEQPAPASAPSTVVMIGIAGGLGADSPASACRSSGRIGSIDRVVRRHVDLDPAGQPVLGGDPRDEGVDLLGWPGDHGLARRGVDRDGHLRVVGDQCLGGLGVQFQQRHRALPATAAPSTATGSRSPAGLRPGVNAPATTAAVTSPIECPITASGSTP